MTINTQDRLRRVNLAEDTHGHQQHTGLLSVGRWAIKTDPFFEPNNEEEFVLWDLDHSFCLAYSLCLQITDPSLEP